MKRFLSLVLALVMVFSYKPLLSQAGPGDTYKVEFISSRLDKDNQRIVYDVQYVKHGDTANPIETPTREGNVFLNWSGGYTYDQPITSDMTIVAIWGIDKSYNKKAPVVDELPKYNHVNVFKIDSPIFSQTIDGKTESKQMDVAPFIIDGRTMMPLRFAAESIGYDVEYDNETRSARFSKGDQEALVYLDSRDFYVNGQRHTFSVDPLIKDDRIMLPVSEIGMALGLSHGDYGQGKNIEWKADTREVIIQTNR